jgi:DNA-binding NarL/FixJ family response regulator
VIRVLLVDDQDLVRAGLRGILRERFGFAIVGERADGTDIVAAVREADPDVVLMDVRMPLLDGVRATGRLRAAGLETPVLALTTFDDDEALAGMLRAGAAGFVLKGVPAEELQRAVRIVAEGGAWLDPAVTSRVLAVYRAAPTSPPVRDNDLDVLTAREREVLALIGHGHTNAEIARDLSVGEGTVKTHVNHLFTKLNLRDRAAAIVFAFDHHLIDNTTRTPRD